MTDKLIEERWPNYATQSWQERFVELDNRQREMTDKMADAIVEMSVKRQSLQAERDKAVELGKVMLRDLRRAEGEGVLADGFKHTSAFMFEAFLNSLAQGDKP